MGFDTIGIAKVSYGHPWALKTNQDHSRVLRSIKKFKLWCKEHSWLLISPHVPTQTCSSALINALQCSWVPMSAYHCSQMLIVLWALMDIAPWLHEHLWALISAHGNSIALMSNHECWWAYLSGNMSTQECSLHHGMNSWISWVLLSTLEWSWVLMDAHNCVI